MQYESRGEKHFKQWLVNGTRDNEGWFVYTWENGTLNVSNSYGKWLNVRRMIFATSGEEKLILNEMIIMMKRVKHVKQVHRRGI